MEQSTDLEAPPDRATAEVHAPARADGRVSVDISNAVVRIFRDYLGRGPTKTRTSIRDNVVVVVLEDTLTKAEKTLAAGARPRPSCRCGAPFRRPCRRRSAAPVAQLTGRRVIAFMSDNHIDPDYAAEVFVLES